MVTANRGEGQRTKGEGQIEFLLPDMPEPKTIRPARSRVKQKFRQIPVSVFADRENTDDALIGITVLVTVLLFFKYRQTLNDFTNRGRYTQSYLLAALFVILSLAGIIIDLLNIGRNGIIALEEFIELNAASALLFCLVSICQTIYVSPRTSSYS